MGPRVGGAGPIDHPGRLSHPGRIAEGGLVIVLLGLIGYFELALVDEVLLVQLEFPEATRVEQVGLFDGRHGVLGDLHPGRRIGRQGAGVIGPDRMGWIRSIGVCVETQRGDDLAGDGLQVVGRPDRLGALRRRARLDGLPRGSAAGRMERLVGVDRGCRVGIEGGVWVGYLGRILQGRV